MIRIQSDNLEKAQQCVDWLVKNVGPVKTGNSGTLVRGEGWQYWVKVQLPEWIFIAELDEHVDDETATIFMLKWS